MTNPKNDKCCDSSSRTIQHLQEVTCDAAEKAGRKLRATVDSASHEVEDLTQNALTQIRANPVQSSLIAAAAGFIVGSLLRRR